MNAGEIIILPSSVKEFPPRKADFDWNYTDEERDFIQNLVIYKDSAVIAVNKPPGLPVQGGSGVRKSLDKIAAACLSFDYLEPPRLVHRLDRDSSGILILGRTRTSAVVLHSIFREETCAAVNNSERKRSIRKTYWALVLGTPKSSSGTINAPLGKMGVDDARSERMTTAKSDRTAAQHHAITRYKVINACEGLTWLELTPLTGRKHQLRVHCAEMLGTPIVGDYKYGWKGHRERRFGGEKSKCGMSLPFGIDMESGSISDERPRLHLHCKRMLLPDVAHARRGDCGFSLLRLEAPLPSYMQWSFDVLSKRS